ncbi:MAG: flippase-like domain-containing protein [Verrucomicrobia bacterium]|nr:flippase-like domain-containing protein [Verrucomicrobiota bacterium]
MLKSAARPAICFVLMLWIFHSIFVNEARHLAPPSEPASAWDQLPLPEQWKRAWTLGPRSLGKTLASMPPAWLAVSLVFMGATLALGVARWKMALELQKIPLDSKRATTFSLIAHFFNSFLLGSTGGDLMKAYYAAGETQHLKTEAVVTVVVDRIFGLFSMLAFAVAMIPFNWPRIHASAPVQSLSYFVFAMFATLTLLGGALLWSGLSKRFPQVRPWLRRLPQGETLEKSVEACRPFGRNPSYLIRSLLLSALLNACCVLQVAALAKGLQLHIPVSFLLLIVPSIICVSALPITPSGLGVRENLYVATLASPAWGVSATAALSLALLAYAGSLFWSMIGGLVYLCSRDRRSLASPSSTPGHE